MILPRLNMELLAQRGFIRREADETILQVGEGNFLRAFVDPFIQELNEAGHYLGSVVVLQPIPTGLAKTLNKQDGLYTLFLQGLEEGRFVEKTYPIQIIQRAVDPYQEWEAFLELGRSESLRFVFSNTTEAGITYRSGCERNICPDTFPGQMTRLLLERFLTFHGDSKYGLVFLPCELIEANGDTLRSCILSYSREWDLGADFEEWLNKSCVFCNTLVDRIVPGYPHEEAERLQEQLGYQDPLMVVGESFGSWVIEAPEFVAKELPLHLCNTGQVRFVPDIHPYRTLKVRILNGSHTILAAVGYLCGVDTVKEAMEDPQVGSYLRQVLIEEILPTLGSPEDEKRMYTRDVIQRFLNPSMRHRLLSISLNSLAKYRVRVLPSLLDGVAKTGRVPRSLAYSLASLTAFYRGRLEDGKLVGQRGEDAYLIQDDASVLSHFEQLHHRYAEDPAGMVDALLRSDFLWGCRLDKLPGLAEQMRTWLPELLKSPRESLIRFMNAQE